LRTARALAQPAVSKARCEKRFEPLADLPYAFPSGGPGRRMTMAFVRHTIDINGCKLGFARAGRGVPLLYLHGTDGLAEWPAILEALAERFDVIAPDHPGFGTSEIPAWIDDVSDVAYLYLDAIEALQLSGIHVVGQSLGGWIALEMAVRSTHRLRSLTLISAAGIHVKGVPKADIFMMDPEEQARLAYADPKLGTEAAKRAGADKYQDLAILNRIASARFGWQPRFFNPRLERWLHRINVPTQIIWGAGDRIIPPAYAEALHRAIPGSTLTMIPNAGHLPHVERTPAVEQAMQAFLRH
jgi:pimeloyl-ACP methyl ester carboxylesterase